MTKYGVFIRFDVDADSEEEAREIIENSLNYNSIGKDQGINSWELYDVEGA